MSLKLPLVFWNEPPILSYTTCHITKNLDRLITGSHGGICLLWRIVRTPIDQQKDEKNDKFNVSIEVTPPPDEQTSHSKQTHPTIVVGSVKHSVEPFAFLYGHESMVTSITETMYDFVTCVCSVSVDGTLCIWSVNDGRCLALSPFIFSGSPKSIVAIPNTSYIAGAGKWNEIEIVDLKQLKVIRRLAHTEWIYSLSVGILPQKDGKETILLSTSGDSTLRYWILGDNIDDNFPVFVSDCKTSSPLSVAHNHDWSYVLIVTAINWMVFTYQAYEPVYEIPAPDGKTLRGGFFLNNSHVFVYTQDGEGFVYSLPTRVRALKNVTKPQEPPVQTSPVVQSPQPSPKSTKTEKAMPRSQSWIANLLGLKKKEETQPARKFQEVTSNQPVVKSPSLHSLENSAKHLSTKKLQSVVKSPSLQTFQSTVKKSISTHSLKSHSSTNSGRDSPFDEEDLPRELEEAIEKEDTKRRRQEEDYIENDTGPILVHHLTNNEKVISLGSPSWHIQGNLLVRAGLNGSVTLWYLGELVELKMNQNDVKNPPMEVKNLRFDKMTVGTVESAWSINALSNIIKLKDFGKITASHVAIDRHKTPKLIFGTEIGKIAIIPAVESQEPTIFQAHDGKVTALFVVFDEEKDRRLFVSGGEDYLVKVWNSHGVLLKEFYNHSGKIDLIFSPPKIIQSRLGDCFCSVAEDRSICLYTISNLECFRIFGGHSSSVVSVYWRVDLDYLIVRCSDGTVYVWQLSSGLLERRVRGKVAIELIEKSEGPGSSRRPTVKICLSKQPSTCSTTKGFLETSPLSVNANEPNIQLLLLNVRRVITFIQASKDLIAERVNNPQKKLPLAFTISLAYAFQFSKHSSVDELRKILGITKPKANCYFALQGVATTYSLIVPKVSEQKQPFMLSPVLSALYTLCCVAILQALSSINGLKDIANKCKDYVLFEMEKELDKYEDPSFLWCAQFLKDPSHDIQSAARQVMSAVLAKQTNEQIKQLADKLALIYLESRREANIDRKQNLVIALAVLALEAPNAVDGSVAAMGLIEILESGGPHHNTAIRLSGDGFETWQFYIPDPMAYAKQLFQLSLPSLNKDVKSTFLSADALKAFVNMASLDTRLYVEFINQIIGNPLQFPASTVTASITSLYPVMEKSPEALVNQLVFVTSMLIKVLDPHVPTIRDVCITPCTNILRCMVEKYPMVCFHTKQQKLCVASPEGIVVIFDLRTASKWQVFEAHRAPIAAIAFSPSGEYVNTFCPKEKSCKILSVDGSGVLNLLGVGSRFIKTVHVHDCDPNVTISEMVKYIRTQWESEYSFTLKVGKNARLQTFRIR